MKKNNTPGLNCHLTRKSLYVAMATISHLMLSATPALAAPAGGKVVGGGGSIDQSGLNTTIRQQTDRMAIDWQSFNVAADEKVKFIQPDSSSVGLNRVLSHSASEIHGQIEANGHILLVNPNGVFFGKNSRINVGGMIASGLHIDPNDFMNGEFTLTAIEGTEGKVINSGIINAATGGSVTLVGQQVKNDGLISAKLGAVNLAAGKEAVITFDASGLVGVRVTEEVLQNELGIDAAVINNGEINAEGGRILLSASTSQDIFSQAVNHGNLNSATSVAVHEDGSFTLGAGANVVNTGNLSVSSTSGGAGQIVLVGENITTSGNIYADAATTNAGQIELHSVDTTLITDSAKITAKTSSEGKGGDVKILGNKVGLLDNAQINASGANGGGQILFGGDETGNNIRIRNADFIYLSENTKVNADAMLNGDGGRLISFASDTARIYGELSARGGALGGNGGFVETSGLKGFEILQTPTISATAGKGGTWLIDPYDIFIKDEESNVIPDDGIFTSTELGATVSIDSINTVLSSGGSVIIQTGGDGGQGDITISDDIEYDIDVDEASLTLNAGNNIIFESDVFIDKTSGNSGTLNIELNAGADITFQSGSYIKTWGGKFLANGRDLIIGDIDTSGSADQNAGIIKLLSGGTLTAGLLTANGGKARNGSSGKNGGAITLQSLKDLHVGAISAKGSDGNRNITAVDGGSGQQIEITSSTGDVTLASVDSSGGSGESLYSWFDASGGNAGAIIISAGGSVSPGKISVSGDLLARGGSRSNDDSDGAGNSIELTGNVQILANVAIDSGAPSDTQTRGNIIIDGSVGSEGANPYSMTLTAKDITFKEDFNQTNRVGALTINATGNVKAQSDSHYKDIYATSLKVTANSFSVGIINTASDLGIGGAVTISAKNNIYVEAIKASGATGGDVTITTLDAGATIELAGDVDAHDENDSQGTVNVQLENRGSIVLSNGGLFTSSINITGSGDDGDSLTRLNTDNTWSIDGKNEGDIGNISFSDIENLIGGDGKDTFTFAGIDSAVTSINGGGGGGENTLIGRDANNTWEIGATNNSLSLTDTDSIYVTTFENINNLQGGSSADTFNIKTAFDGALLGGDGADIFNIDAAVVGDLSGGNGADTFNIKAFINGTLLGGSGNDQFTFFSSGGANNVNGEGGSDTLIGRNDKRNTWAVSADTRSLKETGSSSNYVDRFVGIEALQGGDVGDTFNVTANFIGSLHGGGSADIFNLGASVTNVFGDKGDDEFTITAAGITASLDGGDGNNSLTAFDNPDSDTNVWTISGTNEGNLANGETVSFKEISMLHGGSGIDTFMLNEGASITGTINGGSGDNQLANSNSNTSWTLTARYQGNLTNTPSGTVASFRNIQTITGSGSDTLIGRDQANDWQISGENSGYVQILNDTVDRIDFSGMSNLAGRTKADRFTFQDVGIISGNVDGGDGNGVDTLVGRNIENFWSINNKNQGNISNTDTNTSPYVKFFDIENLLGGRDADTFSFTNSGDITGKIDGGTHGTESVTDSLDLRLLSGPVEVELFTSDSDRLHVLNMEQIIAPLATSMTNFLYGANNQPYTWTIDGTNSGTLTAFENPPFEPSVEFSNFGQLRGGTNDDRFEVIAGGSVKGTIHGGDGAGKDFVDYSGAEAHVAIALGGDGSLDVTGIDGIEGIVGNNDGTSNNPYYSSISIEGGNNIWTIGSLNTDGINDGQIAINGSSTKVISFENFNILNGGSGNDRFNLSANGGQLIGYINGGGGENSFNATASTVDQTVYINSSAIDLDSVTYVAGATQLFGFNTITANAGTHSTLISNENANTWNIQLNGKNLLHVDGNNSSFDGFSRLVGGAEADLFYIHSLDNIPAVVDGGTGAAEDHVYFTPLNPAVGVTVGVGDVSATTDLNIFNIENLVGHDNDTNTLISNGVSDIWEINGSNQGTFNSNLKFNGFANLTGGDGDDKFNIVGENAALSGTMDGGTGDDSLSFSGRAATLELFAAPVTNNFNAINFETISADTVDENFSNTLIAGNTGNDWTIDGLNAGSVTNGAYTATFKGFKNLTGGSGVDDFVFEGLGSLSGYIDGGNGVDSVDLRNLNKADVTLGDTTYRNIEKFIGNGSSGLTSTEASTWNLLGHNSGNVNGILFEGFSSLIGGDGNDRFNLTQGSLSGSVYGGKGNDTFEISGATIDGSVFGDAGNDHFIATITPGNHGKVHFVGGDAGDRLEVRGGNTGYYAQHSFTDASSGEFLYADTLSNKYDLSYTGITNITDNVIANLLEITTTSAADTITLKKDAYSLNQINVNYMNKRNLTIAASAADEVIISGAVNVPELLTVQDARVSATDNSSVITANGLRLDGTAQVGTATNRVNVNINDLYVRYANGAIYLQEQRGLNIGEFSTSSLIDLRLDGDLTSSVSLSSSQDVSITTNNGNIVLDKENALSGGLSLAASNSINLRNLTTTNLKNVSARNLTINSTGVINGGGFIQVDGLASLVSGGNINLANQNHNFNFVQIGSAANVSINNVDSLRLTGVTASGALNINAQGINVDGPIDTASVMLNAGQGDAVLSSNVAVGGIANIVGRNITVDGDLLAANIQLDASQGQVLINGRLNTDGKESVTVTANQVVQNGLISSGTGITVQATDSITQNADITAATDVLLSAGGDLFMNARRTTQGQQVNYSAGGNMALADINATKAINISAAGNANQRGSFVSTSGDIIIESGGYIMDSGAAITANTGSVILKSSAGVSARKINAATDVSLTVSGNVGILDEVATTQGTISIQGRDVTLASNLVGNAGIDVRSVNGDIQQQAQLNSEQGDIRVVADGNITMDSKSSTLSTSGSIEYSGASLGITSFDALKTVTLDATRGAVTDLNGNYNNITAQRLVVDAATGIGSNDIIETLVDELSVSNNVGDIRIQNNKAVTVDRLRSNGNIVFNNLIGSVMLDNSQGTLFSRSETDARLAGGTMNANYDIGTLSINVAAGDLIASGIADLKNPDIVARNAALIAPIGNIGTLGRPLVIYVKDSLFIAGFNSWNPFWAFGASPATVDNASTIQGNLSDLLASGNEALVVVEALNEVDPAIFTSVRNYSYDDISILLPIDQLYYGD